MHTSNLQTRRLARTVPMLIVAAACLFNAVAYFTELRDAAPDINDDVFHLGLIQQMNAAWDAGGNVLDTWIGYWGQGFAVLRYYQHLPHLVVVVAYRLLGETVPLHVVYDAVTLLLLVLLPLAFCVGSRRLGASPITAACIALCTALLGADPAQHHFLGFQPRSFLWSGGGLYTQLAAMVLFPVALGTVSQAALGRRRLAPAIAWLGATWLSHLVLGYVACLLGLVVLLRPEARGRRRTVALRLGSIYVGVAVVASYLLLPALLETQWLARSTWEPREYWDSFGAVHVLAALATGGLLDGNRIPVLTILAGFGAFLAVRSVASRSQDGFAVAALGMFIVALLVFFGRPTWGRLLELLPFSAHLPLHRFICAVQFGGVLLAGLALAQLMNLLGWLHHWRRAAVAGMAAFVVLSPAIAKTAALAGQNAAWRRTAAAADASEGKPLRRALEEFAALDRVQPGRGYAGTSWDWGRDFELGGGPVYHRWTGQDLPAISYMYHTMSLASELEPEFDPGRRDHFELFNVRYVLADEMRRVPAYAARQRVAPGLVSGLVDTEGYFGIVGSGAFYAWPSHDSGPLRELHRAFIASDWHARDLFVRIGWRRDDGARAHETTIPPDQPIRLGEVPPVPVPRGHIIASGGRGDRHHARFVLSDPGLVLFRMTYHPNWRATLDGREIATVMLSPGYIGVDASPGEHLLEMTYRPPRWSTSLPWAGIALLAIVALAGALGRATAAGRVPPPPKR